MTRILYNPQTAELIRWPRIDYADVVGLEPPVVMLDVEQHAAPSLTDPANQRLLLIETVDLAARKLRRTWSIEINLPVVVDNVGGRWVQFAEALAADVDVRDLLWAVEAVNPVLRSMLGVGLGQAAKGDPATFLAAWGQVVASGLVPSGLPGQMAGLAAVFELPADFVEGLGDVAD